MCLQTTLYFRRSLGGEKGHALSPQSVHPQQPLIGNYFSNNRLLNSHPQPQQNQHFRACLVTAESKRLTVSEFVQQILCFQYITDVLVTAENAGLITLLDSALTEKLDRNFCRISRSKKCRGVGVILLTKYPMMGICPERPSGAEGPLFSAPALVQPSPAANLSVAPPVLMRENRSSRQTPLSQGPQAGTQRGMP